MHPLPAPPGRQAAVNDDKDTIPHGPLDASYMAICSVQDYGGIGLTIGKQQQRA